MSIDRDRDAHVVDLLVKHAPALIDAHFHPREKFPSLCVFSTRVGLDALRYFGVDAEPFPVKAIVGNREWVEAVDRIQAGEKLNAREVEATGARFVEIDTADLKPMPDGRRGFPGHLVIALPWADEIVDLDLGQFRREHKNIYVPRVGHFNVPQGFFTEGSATGYKFERDTTAVYCHLPKPLRPYQTGKDWTTKNSVTGKVIRAIRADLEGSV